MVIFHSYVNVYQRVRLMLVFHPTVSGESKKFEMLANARVLQRWRCRDFPHHPFSSPCSAVSSNILCLKNILNPQSSQSVHIFPYIYIYICVYIHIYILWHPYPQWFPLNAELLQVLSHLLLGFEETCKQSYRFRIVDLEIKKKVAYIYIYWLVVSTPLKNIGQMGILFPIYGKKMFQTTNQYIYIYLYLDKRTLHRPRLRRYS